MFRHIVCGPLTLLQDQWKEADAPQNLIDYVNGFRTRLYAAGELAKQKLSSAQSKMKKMFDRRAFSASLLVSADVSVLASAASCFICF